MLLTECQQAEGLTDNSAVSMDLIRSPDSFWVCACAHALYSYILYTFWFSCTLLCPVTSVQLLLMLFLFVLIFFYSDEYLASGPHTIPWS